MSIARPYSGREVPSMMPGSSRNWRRTSSTTWPPTRPTACIASDANRNGIRPPMNRPAITQAFERSKVIVPREPWPAPFVWSSSAYEPKRTSAASAAEPIA